MYKILLIIVYLSLALFANVEKNIDISETFWSKGYIAEQVEHDHEQAYKYFLISANQIHVTNKPKDYNTNYILWSIQAIKRILEEYPKLSTIKDEIDYWNLKLVNSKFLELRDSGIIEVYRKAIKYKQSNDYVNAYKYYLILAKQIDTLDNTENLFDNYILWAIKDIRIIFRKKSKIIYNKK